MRKTKVIKKTKRDLIIDAGIRLFARFPFSEITVAAVAREAQCGHSLIYHYFRNINELYEESIEFITNYFSPYLKSIEKSQTSPLILFVGSVTQLIALLNKDPMCRYYYCLIVFHYAETPQSDRITKLRGRWYKSSLTVITSGIETGVLINLLTAEDIIKNIQHKLQGIVSSLMFSNNKDPKDIRASLLYLPFLKGVHNV